MERTGVEFRPEVTLELVTDAGGSTWPSTVSVSEAALGYSLFTVEIESGGDEFPERVAIQVGLACDEARYLDGQRRLTVLQGEVRPPWPVGCFAVIRRGSQWFQVSFGAHAHFRLRMLSGRLVASFTLRDRRRCGLRLFAEHRFLKSPSHDTVHVSVRKLPVPEAVIWLEPFPRGARSAICITDHPDWDSVAKVRALRELFVPHGVRITKAAFPAADPGWTRYGPGLDDPEYAAEMGRWYKAGHEIAYHGLGSGGDISHLSPRECLARLDRLQPYHSETWIDHGCGEYGFARSARLPGDLSLVDVLRERGVRNFWSYGDVWQNPADNLDIWTRRTVAGAFADGLRLARRRGRMGPLQLAYYGVIPLKNIGGTVEPMRALRRPWSVTNWRRLIANYRRLREINAAPLFIYDLAGDFAPPRPDAPWIFDTVVLQHLVSQFRPANIERLIASNGILIAHTYLAAQHPRAGHNCFRLGTEAEILPVFRENIANLGRLQDRGAVATLPLRKLRERLSAHATARLVPRDSGWDVSFQGQICSRRPHKVGGRDMMPDDDGVFRAEIDGATHVEPVL